MKRWPTRPLLEICNPKQWPTISSAELTESGFPVYGANGQIGHYHSYNHDEPTILITCRGATCGNLNISPPHTYVTGNAMALDNLKPAIINFKFLYYALLNRGLDDIITGAAQPQITRANLSRVGVPSPPLADQERIVKLLNEADELRKLREQADRRAADLIPSLFHEMFVVSEDKKNQWPRTPLAGLCSKIVDCPHSTPIYAMSETPYTCVRSSDIQEGKLDWSSTKYVDEPEYAKRVKVLVPRPGDVVFCREGARLGNAALVTDEKQVCLGQRMMLFRVEPNVATPEFLCAFLLSPVVKKVIWNLVGGSASPHLNVGHTKEFVVALPPLPLQKEFTACVSDTRSMETEQAASRRRLEDLFQSMLHRAFMGEL